MNKPDEAIDKLLAGLRDAQAPQGLERRILEGLEHRAAQRWSWNPRLNWAVAGSLVIAITLVASMHRSTRGTPQPPDQAQPRELATARTDAASTPGIHSVRTPRIDRLSAKVAPAETAMEPGFPAPPMPLTDQEKMLLRLAHRADPAEEIAILTSDGKAIRDAEADAEFNAFFPPPVAAEGEATPMTDEKGETR
jgi:hypothetical protein